MSAAGCVWIKGEITDASAFRTVAEIEASPPGVLQLYVDAIGGAVDEAKSIAGAVKAHKGGATGVCLRGHSAALLPLMACSRIIFAKDGEMLIHSSTIHVPSGFRRQEFGVADAALVRTEREVADALAARSKSCPSSFFTYLMSRDGGNGTRLSAEDAVNYNLCDDISPWPQRHIRDKGRLP